MKSTPAAQLEPPVQPPAALDKLAPATAPEIPKDPPPAPVAAKPTEQPVFQAPAPLALTYLELVLRDPAWLYAAWDFNRGPDLPHASWKLRIWHEGEALPRSEFHLADSDRSRFAQVDAGTPACTAEVGCWLADGTWRHFGWSNRLALLRITPPPPAPPVEPPRFQPPVRPVEPPAEAFSPAPAPVAAAPAEPPQRHPVPEDPPAPEPIPAPSRAEVRDQLRQILGFVEQTRPLTISSLDLIEQANRSLEGLPDAGDVSMAGTPASISSSELSKPAQQQGAARNFWLKVNAELIIFGSTEPGSQLTVAGQPVRLKADGSFRLQFALPDGLHALPVEAVSPDGVEKRTVSLDFARETVTWHQVGVHPPNLALMPPGPAAVSSFQTTQAKLSS